MSKYGEVVVKLEGEALQVARKQAKRIDAIAELVEELAVSRFDLERNLWGGIKEHFAFVAGRSYSFNQQTGEVTDAGPGDEDWSDPL